MVRCSINPLEVLFRVNDLYAVLILFFASRLARGEVAVHGHDRGSCWMSSANCRSVDETISLCGCGHAGNVG